MLVNLFGGAKESLFLSLEKSQYQAGETLRGKLVISTNKDSKARSFRFIIEGKEDTRIVVTENESYGNDNSYSGQRDVTYTDSDTFFGQDLFTFISNNTSFITKTDEGITIVKGEHEISFECIIPSDVLLSYNGNNAWIKYSINATIDKKLKGDLNESISFDVIGRGTQFADISFSTPIVIIEKKNKGLEVKLEVEKSTYKTGDKINGRVTIQNNEKNIRGMEVILAATEHSKASGRTVNDIVKVYHYKLNPCKENESMPFEMFVPQEGPKSYKGKYSELYWTIKAKVDIPMGSDLNALSILKIV